MPYKNSIQDFTVRLAQALPDTDAAEAVIAEAAKHGHSRDDLATMAANFADYLDKYRDS